MNEPHITSTPNNIDITFIDEGFPRCTASANTHFSEDHENCWWVSRVLVSRDEDRGKGYGGRALDILLREIEKQGGKAVIVTPGGYGADPKKQIRFYEAHGFVKVGDTEYNQYWLWTATAT